MPTTADLKKVNEILNGVAEKAMEDESLLPLLLDAPSLMGVEKIELDTVTLRMVARTLPGKQFEVGRRLRLIIIAALTRAGIVTPSNTTPMVGAIVHPATKGGAEGRDAGPRAIRGRRQSGNRAG